MRKASRIISLILAALLVSVGCIGALAQEPVGLESEMIMLINLLGKSPQIKNLNSKRGKTQTPHGPGKRKRRR